MNNINLIFKATASCPTMILWLEERKEEILQSNQHRKNNEDDKSGMFK